jgi:EAL domain-containing protein (putative c-di-GMP-specific phosphodiesterase class I)
MLTGQVTMRTGLIADLRGALERDEFYSVLQPQIAVETGEIVAAEVLCRWRHPVRGQVPAEEFIPVAEESGAIQEIGRFILDEALQAVAEWTAQGRALEVSVNVSPLQLTEDDFAVYLDEQVLQHPSAREALTIEITESRPVADLDVILPLLEDLRRSGVGVALDDYGTGHASPQQLERLPVTELKLDRSLLQQGSALDGDLAATITRARRRGLRVVAEGVETPEQLQLARDLGCDRAQGFLFSAPLERAEFEALRDEWVPADGRQMSG